MKVVVFSTKSYDRTFLEQANAKALHELTFLKTRLSEETVELARGFDAVCVFVNDELNGNVLRTLSRFGIKAIALRCAGFNNVDLKVAKQLGMSVARVPSYSPNAVAEHSVGLVLVLNRHLHRAYSRVRDGNFYLGGLLGFDLCNRTVGIVGTGQIGAVFSKIMTGFGCRVIAFDKTENQDCLGLGVEYVDMPTLFAESEIISLHCPLTPETRHLINSESISLMKKGVMIINTSRGAVIDTQAVIAGLKTGKIGSLGLDVYEEEADVFFEDLSNEVIPDDTLSRLLTFPNVVITGHQAFFTREAMQCIADTTLRNLSDLENEGKSPNQL